MLGYHGYGKLSSALIYRVYHGWCEMSRGVGLPRYRGCYAVSRMLVYRVGWCGSVVFTASKWGRKL